MSAFATGPARFEAPRGKATPAEIATTSLQTILRGGASQHTALAMLLVALAQIVGLAAFGAATLEANDVILRGPK